MKALFQYLLESSLCAVILYAVYGIFLRRETFFRLNRLYLLLVFILPVVLPLLPFQEIFSRPVRPVAVLLDTMVITPSRVGKAMAQHATWSEVAGWIYLSGVIFFLGRFLLQLAQLVHMTLQYGILRWRGFRVVFTENRYSPFSFFGLLFLNRQSLASDRFETILGHEVAHVRQVHSADRMLAGIVTALQWFNPVVWIAAREMKSIHEFLADEAVLQNGLSPSAYQQIILNETMGIRMNDLTNHFNVSLIKKRFTMMTKSKSGRWAGIKVLIALPALVALVALLAARSYSYPAMVEPVIPVFLTNGDDRIPQDQKEREKAQKEKDLQQKEMIKAQKEKELQQKKMEKAQYEKQQQQVKYVAPVVPGGVYEKVDKMPSFDGGNEAMVRFMVDNIKYPEVAKTKGIQGTVFVTFVVRKDGSVTGAKILRGIGSGCDEEAVRVVKAMPKWIPGENGGKPVDVVFNLPVKFLLEKDIKETPKR